MASPKFRERELGVCARTFLFGQRYGHICNSIATLEREIAENTFTNEAILIAKEKATHIGTGLDALRKERCVLEQLAVHEESVNLLLRRRISSN